MSSKKISKSVDFDYLGDKKVEKGKKKFLDETKSWNGPARAERKEEAKEIVKKVKRVAERQQEKVSWKKKVGGIVFVLFMCGVGLFNFISTVVGFLSGTGIETLDFQDTAKLKSVLFSGEPWLVYCVNNETEHQKLPPVLEESRGVARSMGLKIGVLHCFDQTESGRSVAQRFKMNLKPPLTFIVANGNKPRVLNLVGISKPEDLQKRVSPALKLETIRIDALKKWPTSCTSRRTCIVIGHKYVAQRDVALNLFKPLQDNHRSVRIVTVDTSFWQLKLDDAVMATRRKGGEKRAEVLCLSRPDSGTAEGNETHRGTFLSQLDSSSAAAFVVGCEKQTLDLVPLKSPPKIKARPSKPKVVKAPRPRPPPSPRPSPRPAVPKNKKADYVGSRASLEAEEPLFEAVDEEELGDGEPGDADQEDEEEEEEEEGEEDQTRKEEDDDEVEL